MNMLNSFLTLLNVIDYGPVHTAVGVLVLIMAMLSIAVIVIILMQKGTNDNIGVIGGETDTYMGKNKGQNKERKLKIATCILGGVIVVLAIISFILILV